MPKDNERKDPDDLEQKNEDPEFDDGHFGTEERKFFNQGDKINTPEDPNYPHAVLAHEVPNIPPEELEA
jgi:hypothetical protein